MLADILTATNIVLSLIVVVFAAINFNRTRWFIYAVFFLVFMGWTAIYIFVLIQDPSNYNTVWFSTSIIRPLNVLTFGTVAIVMWYRWRRNGNDIR